MTYRGYKYLLPKSPCDLENDVNVIKTVPKITHNFISMAGFYTKSFNHAMTIRPQSSVDDNSGKFFLLVGAVPLKHTALIHKKYMNEKDTIVCVCVCGMDKNSLN